MMSRLTELRWLAIGLVKQIQIMEDNATSLQKNFADLGHHIELFGAAKITREWLDCIEEEIDQLTK